jgi:hypothetical chaperone protein
MERARFGNRFHPGTRNNHGVKTSRRRPALGIDFGTTNCSIAIAANDSTVQFASFRAAFGAMGAGPAMDSSGFSFRSVLYIEQLKEAGKPRRILSRSGPAAIERYLAAEEKGRLIQSLKSWLANRMFTGTEIFGRHYTIEDLTARILSDLRQHAEREFGAPIRYAMAGRPVRFVGADTEEDDAYALSRLREAYLMAGFEDVDFEMEPVAAAYAYESSLDHDELILIGDFGGGTSDFSVIRVGPGVRRRGRTAQDLLGNQGLALAGDAFDARIVRKLVSPALGAHSEARSLNKLMPAVPAWIYANLERWHYLSFLRTRNVAEILKSARVRALEPEKIEALTLLIEEDLGYQLHQAVQQVKVELSRSEAAEFRFREGSLDLRIPVARTDFEQWIAEELRRVEAAVDSLLEKCGVGRGEIDRVFLTGGTSFVPAVRRIFQVRFGEERIRSGNEFTSVAHGLALCALDSRKSASR